MNLQTQHSQGQYEKALKTLGDAVKRYPSHVLCRYHYASTLVTLERLSEALEELQLLRQQVPRESLVCFLMGKVCCLKQELRISWHGFYEKFLLPF